jgi:hypothetical protein
MPPGDGPARGNHHAEKGESSVPPTEVFRRGPGTTITKAAPLGRPDRERRHATGRGNPTNRAIAGSPGCPDAEGTHSPDQTAPSPVQKLFTLLDLDFETHWRGGSPRTRLERLDFLRAGAGLDAARTPDPVPARLGERDQPLHRGRRCPVPLRAYGSPDPRPGRLRLTGRRLVSGGGTMIVPFASLTADWLAIAGLGGLADSRGWRASGVSCPNQVGDQRNRPDGAIACSPWPSRG